MEELLYCIKVTDTYLLSLHVICPFRYKSLHKCEFQFSEISAKLKLAREFWEFKSMYVKVSKLEKME